ncbi:hypothetical protein NA57DRAFT_71391 [Rhizodiscina lignyota]|uniref:C2H2-type domain-containing protein n=1 Tax=Rhizodiscina lignyota TaxID=1504668 RepID=A0A9P4IPY0_9PEZI|nr:hypothetical protein NA57DRAFT_71391 [Rhizodiscina lignyota]
MVEVKPRGKFPCTFKGCYASFETEGELKRHKRNNDEHDYCEIHNKDFESWDELVLHKAVGEDSKDHITCQWCGMDFGSQGGRERHIRQHHPKDQNIPCPGGPDCGETFARASGVAAHLEMGMCTVITSAQYWAQVYHKFIHKKVMDDPGRADKEDYENAARDTDVSGGVSITHLFGGESDPPGLVSPLQPQKSGNVGSGSRLNDAFPALLPIGEKTGNASNSQDLGGTTLVLPDRTKKKKKDRPLEKETHPLDMPVEDYEKRLKNVKVHVSGQKEDPTPAEAAAAAGQETAKPWAKGSSASKELFRDAKPTPPTTNWQKRADEQNEQQAKTFVPKGRFDPDDPNFVLEYFRHVITENWVCNFPKCVYPHEFETIEEITHHLRTTHRLIELRCNICLKIFTTTYGLIGHCEAANGRCQVARSKNFGVFIDMISGGFLTAKTVVRDDVEFTVEEEYEDGTKEVKTMKMDHVKWVGAVPAELEWGGDKNGNGNGNGKKTVVAGYDLRK